MIFFQIMSFIFTLCKVDFTQSKIFNRRYKKMQNTVNVLKNIKYGLKSLSLSLFLVFSVAS